MELIKLLIADDEALVCIGLQSMLKWEQYNIEIVGIAHNGAQEEEMIDTLRPDIVISDIKMPIKSGLEVANAVRKKHGQASAVHHLNKLRGIRIRAWSD